jgi:hypothetical protein
MCEVVFRNANERDAFVHLGKVLLAARRVGKGAARRVHAVKPRGLRCAQPTLHIRLIVGAGETVGVETPAAAKVYQARKASGFEHR